MSEYQKIILISAHGEIDLTSLKNKNIKQKGNFIKTLPKNIDMIQLCPINCTITPRYGVRGNYCDMSNEEYYKNMYSNAVFLTIVKSSLYKGFIPYEFAHSEVTFGGSKYMNVKLGSRTRNDYFKKR